VTLERQQQAEITFLASHDPLTGLPNRRRFEQELSAATGSAAAAPRSHLVLLDVDNFKSLNDVGGHAVGDRVLRELGTLLQQTIRENDFLARLSGDEFALVLDGLSRPLAMAVVKRLLQVSRDYRLRTSRGTFDVTLSAGMYTIEDGDTSERALLRADQALFRAKALGRNRLERWDVAPSGRIAASRAWSPTIKDALRDDRIELHLQPIVSLRDGAVAFHEALCRLRTIDGQAIVAGEWVSHAERLSLMPSIDARMLEQARVLLEERGDRPILVNISASSFNDRGLLARLEETLAAVEPGSLGIEITEHTALNDLERAVEVLASLRERGAVIAVDDFGRGFTSFAELASLPCDIVKIPGDFADDGCSRDGPAVVVSAITTVAHHYGKRVVLEGVETQAMAAQARLLGIEYGQGRHFGVPAPSCAAWDGAAGSGRASSLRG
jgi:diguanylate cyclase (GGDEF)-like protein